MVLALIKCWQVYLTRSEERMKYSDSNWLNCLLNLVFCIIISIVHPVACAQHSGWCRNAGDDCDADTARNKIWEAGTNGTTYSV